MPFAAIYICWGLFIGIWAIGALFNARYAPRTVSRDSWSGLQPWHGWIIAAVGVFLMQAFVPRAMWAAFGFRNDALARSASSTSATSGECRAWCPSCTFSRVGDER